jgi:hypothetical protein
MEMGQVDKNWQQCLKNKCRSKRGETLKRAPMEANFEVFDVSSGSGGNNPEIKEHLEALSNSWCSATT